MIFKDSLLHPRGTSGTECVQEEERSSESPWAGEDMEIVVYVPFC